MLPFPAKLVIEHGGHGRTFDHRVPRKFSVIVRLRRVRPFVDMKMLVLQRVRQLMRHDRALVGGSRPVRDEKLLAVRIVESGDLFGQDFDEDLVERIVLGDQAEFLHGFLVRVSFVGVLVFLHFLQEVGLNFLAGAEALFQRRKNRQGNQLAHFRQHFIGRLQEFLALRGCGRRQGSGRSNFLRRRSQCQEKRGDNAGKDSFHAIRPFPFESQTQINILM